jgi:hypothetical protein
MEGYCSTGQSPQQAVVPVEEEEEFISLYYNNNTVTIIRFCYNSFNSLKLSFNLV